MQYLLLICHDESWWPKLSEAERADFDHRCHEFQQTIVRSGHFRASARLQPTSMATTVRQQDGEAVITDGPFAETKEQVGGYVLLECSDLDEALAIAKRFPSLPYGDAVEVRPVAPRATG